jgi:hypothetical protein
VTTNHGVNHMRGDDLEYKRVEGIASTIVHETGEDASYEEVLRRLQRLDLGTDPDETRLLLERVKATEKYQQLLKEKEEALVFPRVLRKLRSLTESARGTRCVTVAEVAAAAGKDASVVEAAMEKRVARLNRRLGGDPTTSPIDVPGLFELERQLAERYWANRQKFDSLRDHIILPHVRRWRGIPGLDEKDLVSVGQIAFEFALRGYVAPKGTFPAYAHEIVRLALYRHRNEQLPDDLIGLLRDIAQATQILIQKLRREPTLEEIAEILGRPHDDIEEALRGERARRPDQPPLRSDSDADSDDLLEDLASQSRPQLQPPYAFPGELPELIDIALQRVGNEQVKELVEVKDCLSGADRARRHRLRELFTDELFRVLVERCPELKSVPDHYRNGKYQSDPDLSRRAAMRSFLSELNSASIDVHVFERDELQVLSRRYLRGIAVDEVARLLKFRIGDCFALEYASMMPVVDALTKRQQPRIVELLDAFTVAQSGAMVAVSQGADPIGPEHLRAGLDILCGLLRRNRYRNTGGTTIAARKDREALDRSHTAEWADVGAFRDSLLTITEQWTAHVAADQVHHDQH